MLSIIPLTTTKPYATYPDESPCFSSQLITPKYLIACIKKMFHKYISKEYLPKKLRIASISRNLILDKKHTNTVIIGIASKLHEIELTKLIFFKGVLAFTIKNNTYYTDQVSIVFTSHNFDRTIISYYIYYYTRKHLRKMAIYQWINNT